MTDNRTKNSHPQDLWDYRRAKHLLDILATYEDKELDTALIQLCKNWELVPIWNGWTHEDFLDTRNTIQVLAQHALEHGREEYQTRKNPTDSPLDYEDKS